MSNTNNEQDITHDDILQMATDIVASYVSHNRLPAKQIPEVIQSVYQTLCDLAGRGDGAPHDLRPAVPVQRSVTPDYIVCLEDGKKLKMLKRYLRTTYGLTPEEYRRKWSLPADYPMVAPNYAKRRSEFAKQIGLGKSAKANRKTPRNR
ncbi:MAG: MucR family transcriptional regulator [Rhodospirillales bacterium]